MGTAKPRLCGRGSERQLKTVGSRGRSNFGLGLGDFAALDAVGADADTLGCSVDQGVNGLEIRAPAAPGYVVGVRDVIAKLRAFAAYVAYLCHCFAPKSLKRSLPDCDPGARRLARMVFLCAGALYALWIVPQRSKKPDSMPCCRTLSIPGNRIPAKASEI